MSNKIDIAKKLKEPNGFIEALRRNPGPIADTPTPPPIAGTWTLTAPDGRTWTAESPIRCCAAESKERVPAHVSLARIYRAAGEVTEREPVAWQYRYWRSGDGGEPVGWGKWEPVEARNFRCTVQDRVDEIEGYIRQGYRYEIRALYAE